MSLVRRWRKALALVLLALACGRARSGDPSLTLVVHVSPTPPAVGPARILVDLEGASTVTPGEARVTVTALPEDGGPPVHDSASWESGSRYVVRSLPFPTRGEWTLSVRAELADGRWAQIEHPVRVFGGPGPSP